MKDAALQAMLVELAAQQTGLCVISTRERVGDLVEFENSTGVQHDLDQLSPQAGAQLLRALHVKGDDAELEQVATEHEGHALALTLLGSYLSDVCGGDIRRRNEIDSLEEDVRHGRHAERVMRAYEKWLGDGVELAVLRILGLFDRPAEIGSIMALRAAPAILGLTEPFQGLKGREWQQALAKLRRIKLLGAASTNDPNTLDAHPLVREHFKQQLKRERPDAWRDANSRLYEHLTLTSKELPDTVEDMSPLLAAVAHGCAAGRYQETFDKVFRRRIQRTDFNLGKVGAFGAELAALSGFFEILWQQPVTALRKGSQAYVLSGAGRCLCALGRLQEAAQPMQAGFEIYFERRGCWYLLRHPIEALMWIPFFARRGLAVAASVASDLTYVYLKVGGMQQALALARRGVVLADRSRDEWERIVSRAAVADSMHQLGRTGESAAAFREAEEMLKQVYPSYPLTGVWGFQYCDLLLGQKRIHEVKERVAPTLEIAERNNSLLGTALDNLSLGRVWVLEAQLAVHERYHTSNGAFRPRRGRAATSR